MIANVGLAFVEFDQKRALRLSLAGRKVQQQLAGKSVAADTIEPKSQLESALEDHLKAKAELEMGAREDIELRLPAGELILYDRANLGDLDRAIGSLKRKVAFEKRRLA